MRIVVAPDKFKGSLTAGQVADAVSAGLTHDRDDIETTLLPVADGGDGTVAAALSVGYSPVRVDAVGPTGEPLSATYAVDDPNGVAVVELAAVVGLDLLPGGVLEPLLSSTYGLGLVVREALRRGVGELVLGVGGSASTDGGAGMVQAMGARVLDRDGRELAVGGAALREVEAVDVEPVTELVGSTAVMVASDVDNPLLGPRGAAAVFGPQKGATGRDIEVLEAGLTVWSRAVADATGRDVAGQPGAGAAGGAGFAALAVLGAQIRPGIELVLELVGFEKAVAGADLVVTGEGSLDEQSLAGKTPVGVAAAARAHGVPVVAVAGRSSLSDQQLEAAGISACYRLSDLEPDPARSMAGAAPLLSEVGRRIALGLPS
jgi:glycerate 2-kinase